MWTQFLDSFSMLWLIVSVILLGRKIDRIEKHLNGKSPLPVPTRIKKEPYAKPSGKNTPRVNDEIAAWRKENDLDLRDD